MNNRNTLRDDTILETLTKTATAVIVVMAIGGIGSAIVAMIIRSIS